MSAAQQPHPLPFELWPGSSVTADTLVVVRGALTRIVASGSADTAEMEEAEELRRVISAVELVGRNTYLPLAERCLDGMRGGTASAVTTSK